MRTVQESPHLSQRWPYRPQSRAALDEKNPHRGAAHREVARILRGVQTPDLFTSQSLPQGFTYCPGFLGAAEEGALLDELRALPFAAAPYREWQARRRIVSYGGRYDFSARQMQPAPPVPPFLFALRDRLAEWAQVDSAGITHVLINEYSPGTPLGWHRDAPPFATVAGVSLAGHARLRFRPWPPRAPARTAVALELEPRSAYLMRGAARWDWQHAVSPTRELRYSITFRTLSP
ncbi:MAG: alpha-ketoglutarate-dependent dioxygenase AlkB [Proteobacteria bacterium]|nr:alpha-ketoglutarate-dependent dioxygenase AlkB [Pseudomonadota bacterium]